MAGIDDLINQRRDDELKRLVSETIREILNQDFVNNLKSLLHYEITKLKYGDRIKGDERAAEFISLIEHKHISADTLRKRILRGWYRQGREFKQISAKIREWNCEALLTHKGSKDEY